MNVAEAARKHRRHTDGRSSAAEREIQGGYASDLLSDVMGNSREGDIWVTMQKHVNIVAVAQLNGLAAIVLVNGRRPEPDTIVRRRENRHPDHLHAPAGFRCHRNFSPMGIRGRRTV